MWPVRGEFVSRIGPKLSRAWGEGLRFRLFLPAEVLHLPASLLVLPSSSPMCFSSLLLHLFSLTADAMKEEFEIDLAALDCVKNLLRDFGAEAQTR